MKKEYKVKINGETWSTITSYEEWKIDPSFIRFEFNGDKEMIIPKKDIAWIQQIR